MKIEQVRIKDFRGIDDLSLDFRDNGGKPLNLVVLAGPNGSGKTAILEACLIACGYSPLPEKKEKPEFNIRLGAEDFLVHVTLRNENGHLLEIEHSKGTRFPHEKDIDNGPRFELLKSMIDYFSSWREPKLVGTLSVTAGKRGKRPSPVEENRLWIAKQYLVDLTAHRGFQKTLLADRDDPAFQKLNAAWRYFYPQRNQKFVAEPVSEAVEEGFDLFLIDETNGKKVPADKLSSGEIEVLTMLSWFAIKKSEMDILFIDEPELHLHPAWQRIILKALREVLPKTQFICTTHSPQLLSEVPPDSVQLVKIKDNRIVSWKPEASFGLDSNRILEDLLDTPERPIEIKEKLQKLFDLIDRNDLDMARRDLETLRKEIPHEPELAGAEALIRRKEAIGR